MNRAWQLQEAKNKFSNLVERAQKEGPQVVTKHGKEAVVVLSADDYRKLARPKINLHQFLRKSPLAGLDLDLSRDKKAPRNISLSEPD
jgi:antitoxin Phd